MRIMKETEKKVMITPLADDRTASAGMKVWGSGERFSQGLVLVGVPCNAHHNIGAHLCCMATAPTSITIKKNTPAFSSIG